MDGLMRPIVGTFIALVQQGPHDFLRAAHENYGTRRGPEPGSPLLGIDDYVDFVALEPDEAVVRLPSAEVHVASRGRAFHVRILQPDGRETEKDLEVSAARDEGDVGT